MGLQPGRPWIGGHDWVWHPPCDKQVALVVSQHLCNKLSARRLWLMGLWVSCTDMRILHKLEQVIQHHFETAWICRQLYFGGEMSTRIVSTINAEPLCHAICQHGRQTSPSSSFESLITTWYYQAVFVWRNKTCGIVSKHRKPRQATMYLLKSDQRRSTEKTLSELSVGIQPVIRKWA